MDTPSAPTETDTPMPTHTPVMMATLGATSSAPFPIVDRVWEIFSSKGIRTVFLSVGSSSSCAPDLDLAESLGCPIHYVPLNTTEAAAWSEVAAILKERKREGENTAHTFSEGAQTKWILPKNVRQVSSLPWWGEGSVSSVKTEPVANVISPLCTTMKLKDNVTRLDILKLDTVAAAPGLERSILGAVLDAGFRPSVVLVNWSRQPDVDLSTTMAAGHLQNCGYRLMAKNETRYLYYFTDNDVYQICSWEDTTCNNPLVNEICKSMRESLAAAKPQAQVQAPATQ